MRSPIKGMNSHPIKGCHRRNARPTLDVMPPAPSLWPEARCPGEPHAAGASPCVDTLTLPVDEHTGSRFRGKAVGVVPEVHGVS